MKKAFNNRFVTPLDRKIGALIQERREELGMAKVHFAELVGVSDSQISRYESAAQRVPSSRLQKIAEVLQVPFSHFMENTVEVVALQAATDLPADALQAFLASPEGKLIVRTFQTLSPEDRGLVMKLVKRLAKG